MKVHYHLVSHATLSAFNEECEQMAVGGWEPYGDPHIKVAVADSRAPHYLFAQAFTWEENEDEPRI